MRGAGGSEGGIARFFIGLVMIVAGGYMFLDSIRVAHGFGLGRAIYSFGSFHLTSGMVLVPFMFGIGIIFYNSRNPLGWGLSIASLVMLGFGIISNIKFHFRSMSAFDLLVILTLLIGGVGLFLSSLKNFDLRDDGQKQIKP